VSTISKRALRLVPGGAEQPAAPPRSVQRRAATHRRTAVRRDPIVDLLSRLDEEPAGEPATAFPWLTVLLAAVLCAALAAAALLGYRWYGDRGLDRAHQRAVAAAKQATVDFVSVSAATVDRDLQRIVSGATGDFHDEFTRGQAQVRAAVVENNVDSRGTVLRAALVSGDRNTAVVLVAVDATVRNAKSPEGRASHYRIQLDLTHDRDADRWLVAKLQFVG
jgi:Mce-associated membrane protein